MTKAKTQPVQLEIIKERLGFTEVMQEIRGNLQKSLPIMGGAFLEIRLLHTADIHLDWLFERYNRNSREERRREVTARFRQIADIAIERRVHALLLAGDIFHGEAIAESTFQFFRLQIERLSQQGIWTLIVPGNHDPLVEGSYWTRRIFPEHAKVFTGAEWECFSAIPGLEIWGLPFIPANCRKRVILDLPQATGETPRIALVHGQIIEGQAQEDYYPITPADLEEKGVNYLALGHVHRPRVLQWGKTQVVYPGSPTRLTFKEIEERGLMFISVIDGTLTTERIDLPDRVYRRLSIDLNQVGFDQLYRSFQEWRDPALCLKVVLTGVTNVEGQTLANSMVREFQPSFFHLEVDDQTIILPEHGEGRTISERFVQKIADRLQDPAIQDDERIVLKYALQYGLSALKGAGHR